MKRRTSLATPALLAALAVVCACVTEGPVARKPELKVPWPQDNAPENMTAMAEDLMAFEGATGLLPLRLGQIEQAHLNTGGHPYADRGYAYSPSGIGMLRNGWCVLAVNDRVLPKEDGYAWCIVRGPVHIKGTPTLQVVKISLVELSQAASRTATDSTANQACFK